MTRLGRALGPGKLTLVQRGATPAIWTLHWTDASGHRRQQALSSDRRVAERMRSDVIAKRDLEVGGLGAVEGMNTPLAELRNAYVADLRTRTSPGHCMNSAQALARLLGELRATRVRDLKPIDVMAARSKMLAEGLAPRTVNIHVDRLKGMLAWAVDAGLIAESPIARIKKLPDGEANAVRKRRALSEDEIRRLLDAAVADDRENAERAAREAAQSSPRTLRHRGARIPQAPLWRFLVESGCRYGEARLLAWSDVDLGRGVVTLRAETTKARRARAVPITRTMVEELEVLRALQENASERVFLSPERRPLSHATNNSMRVLDRLLDAAGIDRVDAHGRQIDIHALRHTAASRLARNGAPLAVTQRILGHSDPKLTARVYTHLDVEDLREAVEGAARPRTVRGESA